MLREEASGIRSDAERVVWRSDACCQCGCYEAQLINGFFSCIDGKIEEIHEEIYIQCALCRALGLCFLFRYLGPWLCSVVYQKDLVVRPGLKLLVHPGGDLDDNCGGYCDIKVHFTSISSAYLPDWEIYGSCRSRDVISSARQARLKQNPAASPSHKYAIST